MKKVKNNNKDKDIVFQILKVICFIGIGIVLIELIWFGILVLINKNKEINIDVGQNIVSTENGYLKVGSSNFYKSNYNKKTDVEKGIITVYKEDKIVNEIQYKSNYQSIFTDIVKVNDGYLVVGSKTIDKKGTKEGLLLKIDFDGNVIYERTYNSLDITSFRKMLLEDNSIVIVGYSYYSDEVKDDKTKGAIIVKYDLEGNLISANSYGSNVTGSFNDIIKLNNNYYVVGSEDNENAVVVKYDKDLKEISSKKYEKTNSSGFTSIVNYNESLYMTCAKTKEEKNTRTEKASIIVMDYEFNKIKEVTYKNEDYSVWNDLVIHNNNLYLVGNSAKKIGKEGSLFVDYTYKAIIAKYNNNLKLEWLKEFDYDNNDYYKSLIIKDNKILVIGTTNSNIKDLGSSKNNFSSLINIYSLEGKLIK